MIAGSELEKAVYEYWAGRFGCDPADFTRPGTVVIKDEALGKGGVAYVYRIDEMSIVRIGPDLAEKAGLIGMAGMASATLSADGLGLMIEPWARASRGRTLLDCYLDGRDFRPLDVPECLTARRIYPENDSALLLGLYASCSDADLDEAEIYVDEPDPVIFGLFDGGLLVACSSHRYWGEIIADIGVLIHPDYRSRGLGKAVVSVLCKWCLENDVLPMYRVHTDHPHSLGIARALGFKEIVVIESLELEAVADE